MKPFTNLLHLSLLFSFHDDFSMEVQLLVHESINKIINLLIGERTLESNNF